MATVAALKRLTSSYATIQPSSEVTLTFTPGTDVTVDLAAEVATGHWTARQVGGIGPLVSEHYGVEILHGFSAGFAASEYTETTYLYLKRGRSWAGADDVILHLTYDDSTDLYGSLPYWEGATIPLISSVWLRKCHVVETLPVSPF